jgi:putative ABC transport system permease protein
MDWRVLAFTTGLAVLTTILFGLAPAVRATRAEPATLLQSGTRGMTSGRERFGLRRILVVSQVGLSIVLLMGALLFSRSLRNLVTLDVGFQQNGILITSVDFKRLQLPEARYADYKREIVKHVSSIPGVESAAAAMLVPFGGDTWNDNVITEGSDEDKGSAWMNYIGPGYFHTMGTPLLAGRDFDDRDTPTSVKVAIVNQAFVKKILKGTADPLGKRFRIHEPPGQPRPLFEIVGVTGDNKFQDMHEEFLPFMYFPAQQQEKPDPSDQILIKSSLPITSLMASLKQTIGDLNPGIDLEFSVFKTKIHDSLLQDELMILREAGILTIAGLVIGSGLALGAAQAAKSLLYGLKPRDPLTLLLAIVTLSVVASLASFLPAYRASKLDPLTALRYE